MLSVHLPLSEWTHESAIMTHNTLSKPQIGSIEATGHGLVGFYRRLNHQRTMEEDIHIESVLNESVQEDAQCSEDSDDELELNLYQFDPLKWKEQDHYLIIGLSKKRYKATEEDIKRAYRKKVLKHHPDKKSAAAQKASKKVDDSYFKCLQKAWEVLSDPVKRRQFDSVDPTFDETIPSISAKGDFFTIYKSLFDNEARFSIKKNVPSLGDMSATKQDVQSFYDFWFRFESWRSFEAFDEEKTDSADSREEKRYLERINKTARAKRKKEDNQRINKLVEQAYKLDPRIQQFKEAERLAKEAKRKEKEDALKLAQEEQRLKEEQERHQQEALEQEQKMKQKLEKEERERQKKLIKQERKTIKQLAKDISIQLANDLEHILLSMAFEDLINFKERLESASDISVVIEQEVIRIDEMKREQESKLEAERKERQLQELLTKEASQKVKAPWSPKEVTILIKAVKLLPGGTVDRWKKIAEYVNAHAGEENEDDSARESRERTADDCIKMTKQVQQGASPTERTRLQQMAQKPSAAVEIKETPTYRTDESAETKEWTPAQQAALEMALKEYPASQFKEDPAARWDMVAKKVPGKTKKEVKLRVKELMELVKKRAQK